MTGFRGFPTRTRQTPLPNVFFTEVLPFIDEQSFPLYMAFERATYEALA